MHTLMCHYAHACLPRLANHAAPVLPSNPCNFTPQNPRPTPCACKDPVRLQWISYTPDGKSFPIIADGNAYASMIREQGGEEAHAQWKALEPLLQPLQEAAGSLPALALRADLGESSTDALLLSWQRCVALEMQGRAMLGETIHILHG